jgi:hypothetical protein
MDAMTMIRGRGEGKGKRGGGEERDGNVGRRCHAKMVHQEGRRKTKLENRTIFLPNSIHSQTFIGPAKK